MDFSQRHSVIHDIIPGVIILLNLGGQRSSACKTRPLKRRSVLDYGYSVELSEICAMGGQSEISLMGTGHIDINCQQ